MKIGEAKSIAGSLGFPSKMPSTDYAIPAAHCLAGSELAKIPGSICSKCYALHGKASYQMPRAMVGQRKRLAGITDQRWVEAMVTLLTHTHSQSRIKVDLGVVGIRLQRAGGSRFRYNAPGFHRWHSAGDLQSLDHFAKIIEVCRRTPQIKHWLPTRELAIVRAYQGEIPDNLIIRVSATMIDGPAPTGWAHTSTVHSAVAPVGAYECPAPTQDHRCQNCRACWSKAVPLVSYLEH